MLQVPYYVGFCALNLVNGLVNDLVKAPKRQREVGETREFQREQAAQAQRWQFEQLRESHALQERLQRLMAEIASGNSEKLELKRHEFQERMQRLSHEFQQYQSERMRGLDVLWPLKSMPMELFDHHVVAANAPPPLLLLIAPPRRAGDGQTLGVDLRLGEAVRSVLEAHYPPGSQRPVRLLGDIWKPTGKRQEAAMASLRAYLPGLPLLVLDSEIEAGMLYFRVGYQSPNLDAPFFYKTFHNVVLDASPPDEILHTLLLIHQVMACAMADLHYLIQSEGEISPVLPGILSTLLPEESSGDVARQILQGYAKVYQMYCKLFPWGYDLTLDFAERLAVASPALAQTQLDLSIEQWLEQRGVQPQPQLGDPLDRMVGHLKTASDRQLYARARRLLAAPPEPPSGETTS